jgi:hypothetical protein
MNRLVVDSEQIKLFVEAIFPHLSEGQTVSLRSYAEGDGADMPLDIKAVTVNGGGLEPLIKVAVDRAQYAADHPTPAVFCPPVAGFRSKGKDWQAREIDLSEGVVLNVECDENPAQSRQMAEAVLGPATVIVASGGQWIHPATGEVQEKLHLHWRLSEPATGEALKTLKRARRLITTLVGGDTTNVPAVHPIRWPGSWHRKLKPTMARIVELRPA